MNILQAIVELWRNSKVLQLALSRAKDEYTKACESMSAQEDSYCEHAVSESFFGFTSILSDMIPNNVLLTEFSVCSTDMRRHGVGVPVVITSVCISALCDDVSHSADVTLFIRSFELVAPKMLIERDPAFGLNDASRKATCDLGSHVHAHDNVVRFDKNVEQAFKVVCDETNNQPDSVSVVDDSNVVPIGSLLNGAGSFLNVGDMEDQT